MLGQNIMLPGYPTFLFLEWFNRTRLFKHNGRSQYLLCGLSKAEPVVGYFTIFIFSLVPADSRIILSDASSSAVQ